MGRAELVPLMPVFALLGLFVGSFLNVCIDRLPARQSLIKPPSHCPSCNRRLRIPDLIPVFSYLWLRGRCRYCQARIPARLAVVEGVTALLFAFLFWQFGITWQLAVALVYASLLTVIFVVDLERQLVLNVVTYPAMAIALGFSFLWPGLGPISALEGAALGLVVMALPAIILRRGMGMGDIKLAVLVGLMAGFPLTAVTLFLSIVTGGVTAAILLALKVRKRGDFIPFAPFIATSAMITLLWGQAIWQWYLPGV